MFLVLDSWKPPKTVAVLSERERVPAFSKVKGRESAQHVRALKTTCQDSLLGWPLLVDFFLLGWQLASF